MPSRSVQDEDENGSPIEASEYNNNNKHVDRTPNVINRARLTPRLSTRTPRMPRASTRAIALIVLALVGARVMSPVAAYVDVGARGVPTLTDENFERETQTSSGSSSGDWLVLFTDFDSIRGARAARTLAAARESLLERGVVASELEFERAPETTDRFRFVVKRRPSVVLIKRGKCYALEVNGEESAEEMTEFATKTYAATSETSETCPRELTFIQKKFARATTALAMGLVRLHDRVERMSHALREDYKVVAATRRASGVRAALRAVERVMTESSNEYGLLLVIVGLVVIVTAGALAVVTFPTAAASTQATKAKTE